MEELQIKIKKLNIILLILLSLLMIGAVSAASDTNDTLASSDVSNEPATHTDIDKTNSNTNEDNINENEDDGKLKTNNQKTIKQNNNNENTLTQTEDTFNALQTKITEESGGTISLEHDYTRQDGESDIIINKPITINGNGKTINANQKGRIFNITRTGDLTLINVTITGGQITLDYTNPKDYGGAIYNKGNLTIIHSNITNNKILLLYSYGNGGAIYNNGSNLTIIHSNITNNKVVGGSTSEGKGGAINAEYNSTVTINNTQINNNNATYLGGAISIYMSNITINNTQINNNQAGRYGGAIFIGGNGNLTITHSTLTQNNAPKGGAILAEYSKLFIVNHNIFLNNTENNIEIYVISGKEPYNLDCNWFGNNATDYNITKTKVKILRNNNVVAQIHNWLFLNATSNPNFITALSTGDITFKLFVFNKTGNNEVSDIDNGLLYPVNLTLSSTSGSVKDNAHLDENIVYKPIITGIDSVTAKIETTEYTINTLITSGTSFWDLNQTINNNTNNIINLDKNYQYDKNTDTDFIHGITITRNLTIQGNGCTIDGNNTARIFKITNANVTITNITLTKGKGQNDGPYGGNVGGAIYATDNCNITITDSKITHNNANYGGAIHTWNSQININNTNITHNNANNVGGAICADYNSIMVVSSSLFMDNAASKDGGAIYGGNFKNLTVNNNIFLNNSGNKEIYLYKDDTDVDFEYDLGCNWFGNNATDYNIDDNKPQVGSNVPDLKFDNWLFLKATNTTDTVIVFNTSNITFKLCLYNSTATADDKVFDYDNTQVYPINLNITSSKGTVDKKTASLNETIKYNATESGKGSVTASIETVSCTIELTNNKIPASIDVDTTPIILEIGDEHSIIATLNPSEAGNLTYTSNDTSIVVIDDTGKVIAIGSGHAQITISLSNTQYEATTNKTIPITVKYQTKFTINNIPDFTEGSSIELIVNEKNKYTGQVTVTIGTEKYAVNMVDGEGKVTVTPKLSPGTYNAKIDFAGNDNYTEATATSNNFKINKKPDTKLNTNIITNKKTFTLEDKNKKYTVTLKDNKGKIIKNVKVTLNIKGKKYTTKTNNKGVATFKITLNKKGTYTATITYNGDNIHNKAVKKVKLTVKPFKKISKGSKDKATVKKLQRALKKNGYYRYAGKRYLKIDGIYHKWTQKAVKQYQKDNKLKATGTVNYQTAKKLKI